MGFVIFETERTLGAICDGRTSRSSDPSSRGFIAYCGTYSFDGAVLVTHADSASEQELIVDQVRNIRFSKARRAMVATPVQICRTKVRALRRSGSALASAHGGRMVEAAAIGAYSYPAADDVDDVAGIDAAYVHWTSSFELAGTWVDAADNERRSKHAVTEQQVRRMSTNSRTTSDAESRPPYNRNANNSDAARAAKRATAQEGLARSLRSLRPLRAP